MLKENYYAAPIAIDTLIFEKLDTVIKGCVMVIAPHLGKGGYEGYAVIPHITGVFPPDDSATDRGQFYGAGSSTAGLATLRELRRPGTYERLRMLGQHLRDLPDSYTTRTQCSWPSAG